MTAPKPPPRTLHPDEERQIQLFLERAAPLVLVDPLLTAERWSQLASLAHELDLSAAQFRSTMDDLIKRGVIQRMEVDPPKPPPLPGQTVSPDQESTRTRDPHESLPEPPAPPIPPPPAPSSRRQPPASSPQPPASPPQPPASSPPRPSTGKPGGEPLGSNRWRVESAPAPVTPPSTKAPAETFLEFARPSLAAARDGLVTQELEQRVIAHGTRVLGLSPVFAHHLLLDLIAERKMQLAGTDSAPPISMSGGPRVDPRYAEFLKVAAPILAQHRGLTPQSRVLLASLGRERGWNAEEVEKAIALLITREPDQPIEPRQRERLPPFASHVEQHLKSLSGGIVTPALVDKLAQAGCELFGLEKSRVDTTIRETIASLQMAVVTHAQAEQHLRELLTDLLDEGARFGSEHRERLELEAAQWGVPPRRLNELIDERIELNADARKREQRITRLALWGAGLTLAGVALLFVWMNRNSSSPSKTGATGSSKEPELRAKGGDRTEIAGRTEPKSWTESDTELAIALANARIDLPMVAKGLNDLASNDLARRRSAFEPLVNLLFDQRVPASKRMEVGKVLSQTLASLPTAECVNELLRKLFQRFPGTDGDIRDEGSLDQAALEQAFPAVECVARGLSRSAENAERSKQLTAAVQRAAGVAPDPSLPEADIATACLVGLSEQLWRRLIRGAGSDAAPSAALLAPLTTLTTPHLSPVQLQRFEAEWLATLLAKNPARWDEFQELAAERIKSTDPLTVLKFIELFESTSDEGLRQRLQPQLLERVPGTPPETSVDELAALVRRTLGIANAKDPTGQWGKLGREAREVLASAALPTEDTSVLLNDTLKLAHYSALACAYVQNRWEQPDIVAVRKAGPPSPEAKPADAEKTSVAAEPMAERPSVSREQAAAVVRAISTLTNKRTQYPERLAALQFLGKQAETLSDLPPEPAAQVANYLLDPKSTAEHDKVLEQIPLLTRWTQVLVAMVDRIEEALLTQSQLQSLISRIVSQEVVLGEGKPGRLPGRRALLEYLLERTGSTPMSTLAAAVEPSTPADRAALLLGDTLLLQARCLDLPVPEEVAKSRAPEAIVRVLVSELVQRQQSADLPAPLKSELVDIRAEITAAAYLSRNELQETVLLNRLWLKVLGVEIARREQSKSAERLELLEKLRVRDQSAKSALGQLRNGQDTQLQLWLLLGKRG